MFRFLIPMSLIVSVMLLRTSVSHAEDFITKQQRRVRLPTIISPHSVIVFRRARLLVRDDSRAELKLTEEQGERIDTLLADWCEQVSVLNRAPLGTLPSEAGLSESAARRPRNEARIRATADSLEGLREILTPEQHERLEQLVLQLEGLSAIAKPGLSEKLNLTEAQLKQIGVMRRSSGTSVANKGQPTPAEQILALLTPEQRGQWEAMIGKPFFPPRPARSGIRSISAKFPNVRPPLSLVKYETVRTALRLTDEQQRQIAVPVVTWLDARLSWDELLIAGADEKQLDEVAGRIQTAVDEVTEVLDSVLTETQMSRLGQIALQRAGVLAFKRPQVLHELNLSQDQREKISEVLKALHHADRLIGDEAVQQKCREALEILTDEQRQKWSRMTGEPVDLTGDE